MIGKSYRTDLTNEQWELVSKLIPQAKIGGRPQSVNMTVIKGIFYVLVAGWGKSLLPHDFPQGKTV